MSTSIFIMLNTVDKNEKTLFKRLNHPKKSDGLKRKKKEILILNFFAINLVLDVSHKIAHTGIKKQIIKSS